MFNNPGNKYAEKWTPETVLECLGRIEQEAHQEDTNYLGTALMRLRISRRSWSYWKKKFIYDEEIMEQMDLIDGIFVSKLFEGGLKNKINASVTIFGLKHNYKWSDRHSEETKEELPAGLLARIKLPGHKALIVPREGQDHSSIPSFPHP
jgi:hypothetical protein